METITKELIEWYLENKRNLPWRETKNPYYIWISEIMLQQTRVEAVKGYYIRFIKHLPTLKDLANIEEDKLLKLWEGLGYYRRVRNMQKTAKILTQKGMETLPNTFEELLSLPGIGKYTAGAILNIAFEKPTVAIDGNVYRVLGRYYKIEDVIGKRETEKKYEKIMKKILPTSKTGDFIQSFMDLGSLVCTPKSPKCLICPLRSDCKAYKIDKVEQYPVKEKKRKQKVEERVVLLYIYKNKVAIRKRENKGLLASLYEFPNFSSSISFIEVENNLKQRNIAYTSVLEIGEAKHIFSHIIWKMKGYVVVLQEPIGEYIWVTKKELKGMYSLPSAFSFYLEFLMKEIPME